MGLIKELKSTLKDIKENKFDYLFLMYNLVYFSRLVEQFQSDESLILNLFITFFVVLIKKRTINKNQLFFLTIIYLIILILPSIVWGYNFKLYFGFYIRLLTGFLILSYYKENFYIIFEKTIFILAFLSLVFFSIQLINVNLFSFLKPLTKSILIAECANADYPFYYFFVYYVNGWVLFRNSGFMSEPSCYAATIIWAMIINLYSNKFIINTKFIILLIALFTTFSIGGYLSFSFIFIMLMMNQNNTKRTVQLIFIGIFILGLSPYILETEVVKKNTEDIEYKLNDQSTNEDKIEKGKLGTSDVSRVSGLSLDTKYFAEWPFGYGLNDIPGKKYLGNSPNGLITLIVKWGIGFIIILLISSFRFAKILQIQSNIKKINLITKYSTIIAFIFPLAGYSYFGQPFIWLLFLYPIFTYFDFKSNSEEQLINS